MAARDLRQISEYGNSGGKRQGDGRLSAIDIKSNYYYTKQLRWQFSFIHIINSTHYLGNNSDIGH